MIKLYQNIKRYRDMLNISQEELADKMHYSDKSMISKIENGKIDLSLSKIIMFAEVLNVDPDILIGFSDNDDEQALIQNYRRLNTAGRDHINRQMSFAIQQPDFLKNTDAKQSTG